MPNPNPNPASPVFPNPVTYDTTMKGVVIDNVTKLWWEQPIDQTSVPNCAGNCTQASAIAYCKSITLGGKTGWRLPTRIELVSLVDYTKKNAVTIDDAFASAPGGLFWSASPLAGSTTSSQGWVVNFGGGNSGGNTYTTAVTTPARVRCVHP